MEPLQTAAAWRVLKQRELPSTFTLTTQNIFTSKCNLLPSLKSAVQLHLLLNQWLKQNYWDKSGSWVNVTLYVWKEYKQKLPFGLGIHQCEEATDLVTIHFFFSQTPLCLCCETHLSFPLLYLSCPPPCLYRWSPSSFSRSRMWRNVCRSAR